MLKKLASLLFEEEEEVVEEEVNVKAPERHKPFSAPKKTEAPRKEPEDIIVPLTEEKVRSNFGIEADDPDDGDSAPLIKQEPIKKVKPLPKQEIYDFHPVISPIFGVSESTKKDTSPRAIPDATPILPRSRINTVISPIYGDMEATTEIKHISIPDKPKTTKDEKVVVSPKVEFENFDLDALLNTLNDENDEPLEPLKPQKPMSAEEAEAHQFSLFDELK